MNKFSFALGVTTRRRQLVAAASCVTLTALVFAALPTPLGFGASKAVSASPSAIADGLPRVSLLDQKGRPVSLDSLKGKPVLVGFIHTSCKGPCELMTAKMREVAKDLGARSESTLTMVSITTDPEEDGPSQLLSYAKAQSVDAPGWFFLTGKPAEVDRVLAVYNIPHDEDDEMTHVLDLFLLAADGRQVRHYHGTDFAAAAIAADVRKTLARQ